MLTSVPEHEVYPDGLEDRFLEAWEIAFEAAEILKKKFKVKEVRVTGSLIKRERYKETSDIDLVVPEFSMSEMLDCGKDLDKFYPWEIDIIPLKSTTQKKAEYFYNRSIPIGRKKKKKS
ncbi:MAG: nucleotidyltransferase family protein [Fibrobacterota bacterium]